jgi:hypothetical protein
VHVQYRPVGPCHKREQTRLASSDGVEARLPDYVAQHVVQVYTRSDRLPQAMGAHVAPNAPPLAPAPTLERDEVRLSGALPPRRGWPSITRSL